ncbi:Alkaline-phosphatase-like, core domain protein [Cordyceps fumosorosea ARSEF 2679]|uniref:Alkaline-phosphatase-like, core domain protein n=1 Tax=Cordyceps fumosorosea (strain ARSEF 2679) TaxID=1081104 RepID=A0A162JQD1_CORFA|nr:Alkaline-phosphatase-like, core domain protein [Cordyceps fumosorosea ARSEF 2679]OAA72232.1 Alkaline-phosphatase-like, core domain protein [Cordyceps fumosorosea ARSEF 2679]
MPFKNILLLVADDLGREQLGCYGCTAISTPNLDRLAASRGARFDMAFASTASCSGSRTTIYTGLHTHENGSYGLVGERNGFQTWAHVETAPKLFNALGYKTGILGKVHVAPESAYPWETRRESETRNTALIADQAEEFFQEARAEERGFFLTIGYVDPHRVLASRGKFGNEEGNYDQRLNDRVYKPEEVQVPSFLQDVPAVREELAEYYRAINRLDQGVGLVLDALERHGLSDDTLVLFLSDNGPPFVNSKTTLYDAGIHLPFILRVPGLTHGQVNPNMVSWTDVLPTFLDWAGHAQLSLPISSSAVPSPPRHGRSLLPIAHASTVLPGWGQRVFGSHTFHEITNYWPTRTMRTRRYKYHRNVCWKLDFPFAMDLYASLSFEAMRNADPPMAGRRPLKSYICRPPEELYDLDEDPEELRNLAGSGGKEEVLKEMRREVEAWQMETKDLWLWKDGVAVQRFKEFNYEREGLLIPDRFDMDLDNLAAKGVPCIKLHS